MTGNSLAAQIASAEIDYNELMKQMQAGTQVISSMPKLAEVKKAAHEFAAHVKFDPGARYEDFDASLDKKAEYGTGGLVAAGVGVAVAKKLGILALGLKFIKPLLIGLFALFAAFKNRILGLFGRKTDPLEGED